MSLVPKGTEGRTCVRTSLAESRRTGRYRGIRKLWLLSDVSGGIRMLMEGGTRNRVGHDRTYSKLGSCSCGC